MKIKNYLCTFLLLLFSLPQFAFTQDTTDTEKVFVTANGKKYHKAGCSYLSSSSIERNLSDVTTRYSACSRCFTSKGEGSVKSSGSTPSSGKVIHTGPRGGKYYINKNGNKTYIRKKK